MGKEPTATPRAPRTTSRFTFGRTKHTRTTTDTTTPQPYQSTWHNGLGLIATRALQSLSIIAFVTLVIFALNYLGTLIIPILLALIIASALRPAIVRLQKIGLKPMGATWLTLISAILIAGGIITAIVNAVRNQWPELTQSAGEGLTEVQTLLDDLPWQITDEQIEGFKDTVTSFLTSSQFGSSALAGVSATGTFIAGMFLMFVVLFFFMKDGPQIWEFMLRPFTGEHYERARRVGNKTVVTLGQYVRGTAAVAAVDAIGIGIGLAILKVPLALPLAVIVFLTAFIPLVGATLAGALAALVALVSNGPVAALIVIGIVILVNQLEGNYLQPKIMGKTLSLHPLVILLALTAGTILGGILGAVLSVPVAAVAWGILSVWDGPHTPARFVRAKTHAPVTD
ncbi:AI-2E family transporter [Timonella sp. A28]|uniref:AI-2E family transporter n=1 Tax=Timonella sp. A28 TaxID=3442640 RepID=UPI003EB6B3BA